MITDAVVTKLQQKLHPDQPLDFGELGHLLPRDMVFKQSVDQWLHIVVESGVSSRLLQICLGR